MDIITTHLHADFDGLASMVAARKLYPGAVLVFPGGAQETVRRFLAVHDLGLTRLKDLDLQQVTASFSWIRRSPTAWDHSSRCV